jgi:hypothetical protein
MFWMQGVTEELGVSMSALNKFMSDLDTVNLGFANPGIIIHSNKSTD